MRLSSHNIVERRNKCTKAHEKSKTKNALDVPEGGEKFLLLTRRKEKKRSRAYTLEELLALSPRKMKEATKENIIDVVSPAVLSSQTSEGSEMDAFEVPSSFTNTKIIQKNKVNITEIYQLQIGTLESIRNLRAKVVKEDCIFREYYVEEVVETENGLEFYWEKGTSEIIGGPQNTHVSFSFEKNGKYIPIHEKSELHNLLIKKIKIAMG